MAGFSQSGTSTSLPQSLQVYLMKWLKEATLGNVTYCYAFDTNTIIFQCMKCCSNFMVASTDFPGCLIPYALQEWVKQHRHEKLPEKQESGWGDYMAGKTNSPWTEKEKADAQALKNIQAIKAKKLAQEIEQQYKNLWNGFGDGAAGIKPGAQQISPDEWKQLKELAENHWSGGLPIKSGKQIQFYDYNETFKPPAPVEPPKPRIAPLPEPRGRKFRDVDEE